jgi:imidazole glycerol-phosphate synthase subunit HisH
VASRIAVLDYGIGNLHSAQKSLGHIGADARLTADPREVEAADGVVLPGVGHFGRCAEALASSGLEEPARSAIAAGVPFLGVCIGMQLLYEASEEAPGTTGLAVLPGKVRRLPDSVKRPQMQWNKIERVGGPSALLDGIEPEPWAYFVHSFAAEAGDEVVATCDYGGPVVAVVERDQLWATQFHPEKSGRFGLAILSRFVSLC